MWGTGPGPRGVGFAELCPCPCAQDTVKGFVVELEQQISQLQQHREKQEAVVKQLQGEHQGTVPDTWTQWAFPPPLTPPAPTVHPLAYPDPITSCREQQGSPGGGGTAEGAVGGGGEAQVRSVLPPLKPHPCALSLTPTVPPGAASRSRSRSCQHGSGTYGDTFPVGAQRCPPVQPCS